MILRELFTSELPDDDGDLDLDYLPSSPRNYIALDPECVHSSLDVLHTLPETRMFEQHAHNDDEEEKEEEGDDGSELDRLRKGEFPYVRSTYYIVP